MPRPPSPLKAYLRVQQGWEREALYLLKRAAAQAEKDIRRLAGDRTVSGALRREQLQFARKQLYREQAKMWKAIGQSVMAARAEAAAAAIDGLTAADVSFLRNSGMSRADVKVYERSLRENAVRNIDNFTSRELGYSKIELSKQVYRTEALSKGWLDQAINRALTQGTSARALAKDVYRFISPDTPGGASYAALRLGRTELNNAFHATSVRKMRETPWVEGVQWELSGSHPRPDECNEYADGEHMPNGDPGVFAPSDVPPKPHPNCLCYITPVTVTDTAFRKSLTSGSYDSYLDDVMRKNGYTEEFIASSRFA